jgi:hypothetical protein
MDLLTLWVGVVARIGAKFGRRSPEGHLPNDPLVTRFG